MKVSVIVPIYNAERYLKRTLQQLARQTFSDVEFILIDDGSSDNSLKILNKWSEKKDNRFEFYYQENSGVSLARNKGIAEAKGDYIIFVDGDDIVSDNFVESYYQSIVKDQSDIAFFSVEKLSESGENLGVISYKNLNEKPYYSAKDLFILLGKQKLHGYPFMYISKKELWNKNSFEQNIKFQEDVDALAKIIFNNPNIRAKFHSNISYYYVQNSQSALHNMKTEEYKQFVEVAERVVWYAERMDMGTDIKFVKALLVTNINTMINIAAVNDNQVLFIWARQKFLKTFFEAKFDGSIVLRRYIQYFLIKFKMIKVIKLIYKKIYTN